MHLAIPNAIPRREQREKIQSRSGKPDILIVPREYGIICVIIRGKVKCRRGPFYSLNHPRVIARAKSWTWPPASSLSLASQLGTGLAFVRLQWSGATCQKMDQGPESYCTENKDSVKDSLSASHIASHIASLCSRNSSKPHSQYCFMGQTSSKATDLGAQPDSRHA